MDKRVRYTLLMIIIIGAIFVTAPLFAASFYCFPSVDDYCNGAYVHLLMQSGGTIWDAVKLSLVKGLEDYFSWQGAYITNSWMYLSPGLLGYEFYFISPIVIMTTLILGGIGFFQIVFKKILQVSQSETLLVGIPIITYWIAFMPSTSEGIYWNCGALYYTLFFSLQLVYFAGILFVMTSEKENKWHKGLLIVCAILLGGNNLLTGLQTCIILCFITLGSFIKKNKTKKYLLVLTLIQIIAFMVNVLAPGNSVRGEQIDGQHDIIFVLGHSFFRAAKFILEYMNGFILALILFEGLLFWIIFNKTKMKKKNPLWCVGVSFCIFSATFTPNIYAQGLGEVAGRIADIYYFTFVIFVILNVFYITGWIHNLISEKRETNQKRFNIVMLFVIMIAGSSVLISVKKDPYSVNGLEACREFKEQELQTYRQEVLDRIAIYTDDSIKNAEVKAYIYKPYLIYFDDIRKEEDAWQNVGTSRYFSKETVKVKRNE